MDKNKLAIHGGTPVRTAPWPVMYPGGTFYGEEEKEAVIKVIDAQSPFRYYGIDAQHQVELLEKEFSEYIGNEYSLGVASGSMALTCALAALGVGPGCEVVLPALMWISDVNSVMQLRAIPVLCDVDETWNMDPERLESVISPRTKAIVAIHMSGTAANIEEICKIAKKHNIPVLEDCSQSVGTTVNGKQIGSFGDIATFSLQYNKTITSGEGGLISTNSKDLYIRAKSFHDVGYTRAADGEFYSDTKHITSYGFGCRMDEVRGALGRVQLKKLPKITSLMRGHQESIKARLQDIKGFEWRKQMDPAGDSGTMLGWIVKDKETCDAFKAAMRAEGLPVVCPPGTIHQYRNMKNLMEKVPFSESGCPWNCPLNAECNMNYSPDMLPQSNDIFDRAIGLPMPPLMTEQDENDVVEAFRKVAAAILK